MSESPFRGIQPSQWLASNTLSFAILDRFPVSDGHTLVIPHRLVPDWWSCTDEERRSLMDLVDTVRGIIDSQFAPTGYNIGFNIGASAGQTVAHMHVHVIPRYDGDMTDPRGGVRHVIPERGNYLVPATRQGSPTLVTPQNGQMRKALVESLSKPDLDRVDLLVSFVQRSGLDLMGVHLDAALARGAHLRVLTTDYLGITDPAALGFLVDRLTDVRSATGQGELEVRVFSDQSQSFHPKAYLFTRSTDGTGVALVGSSNLSRSALEHGIEWNLETTGVAGLRAEFNKLWNDPRSQPLNQTWLSQYQARRTTTWLTAPSGSTQDIDEAIDLEGPPTATGIQRDALDALERARSQGFQAGLVVMATGLGKTWLAAFDSTRPVFRRVLFVAHREEILQQSRDVFRRLRPDGQLTMFVADERQLDGDVVFASIQSLSRHIDDVDPQAFDYVVVDEFHHADAPTYRRVLSHLRPRFLLGLTATPERSDRADLLALCGDNLVFECDLVEGIKQGLLSPFAYRAIRDVADYEEIPWRSGRFETEALSERLETQARVAQVLDEWHRLDSVPRRALGFCCSISHADFMADAFRRSGIRAAAVHSGSTSAPRSIALDQLEQRELEVIFTVDLFNEGVDVPALDTILMLRPTESPVVFLQQLGRGLRRHPGKDRLDVIDLVGNHRGFLLKARVLAELGGMRELTHRDALEVLGHGDVELPRGCSIVVETEVIDVLRSLLPRISGGARRRQQLRDWAEAHEGRRPTALEYSVLVDGAVPSGGKGWFGALLDAGLLNADEEQVIASELGGFLLEIEKGHYTKSFKLVTLQALLNAHKLVGGMPLADLAAGSWWLIQRDRRLRNDIVDAARQFSNPRQPGEREWFMYWRRNPIAAWLGENLRTADVVWFALDDQWFVPTFDVPEHLADAFTALTAEIVEYRLHRYLATKGRLDLGEHRLVRRADQVLDAKFMVETVEVGQSVVIESAGGARGGPSARNVDYVEGLDLILRRLGEVNASLTDIYLDTAAVRDLPSEMRRVHPGQTFPIDLADHDLEDLRRRTLRSMTRAGRREASVGGGNPRKRLRMVIDVGDWSDADLADWLAEGTSSGVGPVPLAEGGMAGPSS